MTPLESAKAQLVISELWLLRGWHGKPGRSCRVPYREDRAPSGSVLAEDRLFHDFGSGETFDAPGLLARVEELTAPDACRLFIQLAGGATASATPKRGPQWIQKARAKIELPPMDPPSCAELRQLAALRAVSIEACEAAVARKHLFCATWGGARCWIITDNARRNAQVRQLCGEKFRRLGGEEVKALTARGACASWPVGATDADTATRVMLCEGGGDFLAAYHFAVIEETLDDALQPVAMLGAAQRIAPDALPHFAGKRIRIFPHLDGAGAGAALRWESQLRAAGIDAHCYDLAGITRDNGAPVKDLNDLTRVSADDFEANRELWTLTSF